MCRTFCHNRYKYTYLYSKTVFVKFDTHETGFKCIQLKRQNSMRLDGVYDKGVEQQKLRIFLYWGNLIKSNTPNILLMEILLQVFTKFNTFFWLYSLFSVNLKEIISTITSFLIYQLILYIVTLICRCNILLLFAEIIAVLCIKVNITLWLANSLQISNEWNNSKCINNRYSIESAVISTHLRMAISSLCTCMQIYNIFSYSIVQYLYYNLLQPDNSWDTNDITIIIYSSRGINTLAEWKTRILMMRTTYPYCPDNFVQTKNIYYWVYSLIPFGY